MASINETRRLRDLRPETLARYDLAGPRYTSYPTAPQWHKGVNGEALAAHLDRELAQAAARPLSIYMHLPFCIEHCTFCGCNVIVSPLREAVSEPYVETLAREVERFAEHIDTTRPVAQLHWGGGTPTYLSPDQLLRVHEMAARRFRFAEDAEKSIEVHVSWTTDEHLAALAECGFNRISMGVQDFNERTQQAINRRQTFERTREMIELARGAGMRGINCDLVYGLPHQSVATFRDTIERMLELRPDRLALYNFAYLPTRMRHQAAILPEWLPSPEEKFRIFLETHDAFVAAGYRYIGMDHFALPEDELAVAYDEGTVQRNFMGFTTHAGADLLGMGVSAISHVSNMFAQNVKKLPAWERALAAGEFPVERGILLDADDLLREDVIGGLMCRDHIDKRAIEARHGIVFDDYFRDELRALTPMIEDELLTVSDESLDLNFLGRLFVRNIAMVFDRYLGRPTGGPKEPQYSRTL